MDLGGQILNICNYQDQKIAEIDRQIDQLRKVNTPQAQQQITRLYQQRTMEQSRKESMARQMTQSYTTGLFLKHF